MANVLVATEDPRDRSFIESNLKRVDHVVTVVPDCRVAEQMIEERTGQKELKYQFHLVILVIGNSDRLVFDLAKAIRGMSEYDSTAILIVGPNDPTYENRALRVADRYLARPLNGMELLMVAKELVDHATQPPIRRRMFW